MKNYTFTRDLNLGIVQLNVKRGEMVTEKNGIFIYNNQKYSNIRDFQIALQKGWLVDSQTFVQSEVKDSVVKKENNFGFSVKKQEQEGVLIPIKKFMAVEVNQKDGYIEEDGMIKDISETPIHVSPQKKEVKKEQSKTAKKEEVKKEEPKKTSKTAKKEEVKKEQSKTAKKEEVKKEEPKKTSKIIKKAQVIAQKETDSVRGMKIIKGE